MQLPAIPHQEPYLDRSVPALRLDKDLVAWTLALCASVAARRLDEDRVARALAKHLSVVGGVMRCCVVLRRRRRWRRSGWRRTDDYRTDRVPFPAEARNELLLRTLPCAIRAPCDVPRKCARVMRPGKARVVHGACVSASLDGEGVQARRSLYSAYVANLLNL